MHEGDHGILDDLEPAGLPDGRSQERETEGGREEQPKSRLTGTLHTRQTNAETVVKFLSGAIVAALIGAFLFLRFL